MMKIMTKQYEITYKKFRIQFEKQQKGMKGKKNSVDNVPENCMRNTDMHAATRLIMHIAKTMKQLRMVEHEAKLGTQCGFKDIFFTKPMLKFSYFG